MISIILDIKGQKMELTLEEAAQVYTELSKVVRMPVIPALLGQQINKQYPGRDDFPTTNRFLAGQATLGDGKIC